MANLPANLYLPSMANLAPFFRNAVSKIRRGHGKISFERTVYE